MKPGEFSQLLEELYAGPVETEPWVRFLGRLRLLGNAMAATLILRSPRTLSPGYLINVGASAADNDYRRRYFLTDPFVGLPDGRVMTLGEMVPPERLRESDFYRLHLAPAGAEHVLGADVRVPSGIVGAIRLSRTAEQGEFSVADRLLLQGLVPHLRQAVELFARLDRMGSVRSVYAETLDLLALGVLVLDRTARVLESNEVGDAILAEEDGLALSGDVLAAADPTTGGRLRRAVETMANAAAADGAPPPADALKVERPSGRPALGLVVRPAPHRVDLDGQHVPTVAVFLSDPARIPAPAAALLAKLFGLTSAEAALAVHLSQGRSLEDSAERLGVSRNTVRTQLRALFAKTGTTRQAALVRHILASVAPLGGAT